MYFLKRFNRSALRDFSAFPSGKVSVRDRKKGQMSTPNCRRGFRHSLLDIPQSDALWKFQYLEINFQYRLALFNIIITNLV